MTLSSESKLFLGIIGFTVVVITVAIFVFSQPAKPLEKTTLIPVNSVATGSAQAKTWLVEYSDFQCPACGAFEPVVEDLLKKYPDTLYFVYRNFPLDQHPFAVPAAQAALAANLQGKYWEMHHLLFTNQATFSDATWLDLAKKLNLDTTKFTADMKSGTVNDTINADKASGNSIGIDSTPTFYLNGIKLVLNSPGDLKTEVEKVLQ